MHDPECHTGVKSSCLWTQIWRQFWDLDQGSEDETMDGRFSKQDEDWSREIEAED